MAQFGEYLYLEFTSWPWRPQEYHNMNANPEIKRNRHLICVYILPFCPFQYWTMHDGAILDFGHKRFRWTFSVVGHQQRILSSESFVKFLLYNPSRSLLGLQGITHVRTLVATWRWSRNTKVASSTLASVTGWWAYTKTLFGVCIYRPLHCSMVPR